MLVTVDWPCFAPGGSSICFSVESWLPRESCIDLICREILGLDYVCRLGIVVVEWDRSMIISNKGITALIIINNLILGMQCTCVIENINGIVFKSINSYNSIQQ